MAVTVYAVEVSADVGVPEITQVDVLSVSVPGSAGEIVQLVIAAPPLLSVEGVTLIAEFTEPLVPAEAE